MPQGVTRLTSKLAAKFPKAFNPILKTAGKLAPALGKVAGAALAVAGPIVALGAAAYGGISAFK